MSDDPLLDILTQEGRYQFLTHGKACRDAADEIRRLRAKLLKASRWLTDIAVRAEAGGDNHKAFAYRRVAKDLLMGIPESAKDASNKENR